MSKKIILVLLTILTGLFSSANANYMIDSFGDVSLVKNDGISATWLSDANFAATSGYDADGQMTWQESVNWIASLNASNYLGHSDWHLPTTVDGLPEDGYDGTTTVGYNIQPVLQRPQQPPDRT
jgi:hypothetical protein